MTVAGEDVPVVGAGDGEGLVVGAGVAGGAVGLGRCFGVEALVEPDVGEVDALVEDAAGGLGAGLGLAVEAVVAVGRDVAEVAAGGGVDRR